MAPLNYSAKFDPFLSWDCAPALQHGAMPGKEGIKFCHRATLFPSLQSRPNLQATFPPPKKTLILHSFSRLSTDNRPKLQNVRNNTSVNNYDSFCTRHTFLLLHLVCHLQWWTGPPLFSMQRKSRGRYLGATQNRVRPWKRMVHRATSKIRGKHWYRLSDQSR